MGTITLSTKISNGKNPLGFGSGSSRTRIWESNNRIKPLCMVSEKRSNKYIYMNEDNYNDIYRNRRSHSSHILG
jgi:hypothetical protein